MAEKSIIGGRGCAGRSAATSQSILFLQTASISSRDALAWLAYVPQERTREAAGSWTSERATGSISTCQLAYGITAYLAPLLLRSYNLCLFYRSPASPHPSTSLLPYQCLLCQHF